jgi:PhzF family phenazine biosynthesis protein
MKHTFHQVNVFSRDALAGNPLAVVHGAAGLSDARMATFARWTNLSETTFLLPPTDPLADYRVRIFTPFAELPFAGHPTLGSCHAWLAAGGRPRHADSVVQQCGVGRVSLRRDGGRLAFAAPPLRRSGPLEPAVLAQIDAALGLAAGEVQQHQWVDNGPGWCAVMLHDAGRVLSLAADWDLLGDLKLGVVAPHPAGHTAQFEVRAFIGGGRFEDPVTGSLNAALAQWLISAGLAPAAYIASQGTVLQRAGQVFVQREAGTIWVGGEVTTVIAGTVVL